MIWVERLSSLRALFEDAAYESFWVPKEEVLKTLDNTVERFEDGYGALSTDMAYIFSGGQDIASQTDQTIALTKKWHQNGKLPSLAAIAAVSMENLGFDPAEHKDLVDSVLTAAVLGDIKNDLTYHNNLHFCKVTLHVVRMIVAHNRIFERTPRAFDLKQIAALLIGGAIHDLGHDGSKNIIDHKYHFALLEKKSFNMAYPFLKKTGVDEDFLKDIGIILMTTDVSPFGDPISPANQLRAAYEYHYGEGEEETLALSEELSSLEDNDDLCMMCMIMHEADLMHSTGLSYDVTTCETALLSEEIGKKEAFPEDLILFLVTICNGGMMTDAWQVLALDNFEAIYAKAREDFKNGNKPYPASDACCLLAEK